jgi:sugar phosphate isomerase/epimerase
MIRKPILDRGPASGLARSCAADRRAFLAALALGSAASMARRAPAAPRPQPIGVQLYTVRALLQNDFEGTLAQLAAIGFREVEFAGYLGRGPQAVRAALNAAGLEAPSAHVPVETARNHWPRALETAHAIGHRYLVVAWLPETERTSLDRYRATADLFNRVGEQARAAGLRFAYHNHAFEFEPREGRLPYDVLLERCDPRHVAFEMDLYWIAKGGQDPRPYFTRWPGRFPLVHIKDSAGAPEHRMVDVGGGTIPWRAILAQRQQAGIQHYFIEHDEPADPLATARAGYEYLRRLAL